MCHLWRSSQLKGAVASLQLFRVTATCSTLMNCLKQPPPIASLTVAKMVSRYLFIWNVYSSLSKETFCLGSLSTWAVETVKLVKQWQLLLRVSDLHWLSKQKQRIESHSRGCSSKFATFVWNREPGGTSIYSRFQYFKVQSSVEKFSVRVALWKRRDYNRWLLDGLFVSERVSIKWHPTAGKDAAVDVPNRLGTINPTRLEKRPSRMHPNVHHLIVTPAAAAERRSVQPRH